MPWCAYNLPFLMLMSYSSQCVIRHVWTTFKSKHNIQQIIDNFQYNNNFCKQIFGLLMGSLLNEVFAHIYLEFLESVPFKYIQSPVNSNYFRSIDVVLLIYPQQFKKDYWQIRKCRSFHKVYIWTWIQQCFTFS